MTDAITRCPKCHTSFRINEELINSAKGSVRCGSCLTIFNAKENLLDPPAQNTAEASEDSSATEETTLTKENDSPEQSADDSDSEELIHDDARISDLDDSDFDDEEFGANVFLAHQATRSDISLFERKIKEEDDRELENADTDESWALSLLDDEESDKEDSSEKDNSNKQDKTIAKTNPFQIIEEDEELDSPSQNEYEANFYPQHDFHEDEYEIEDESATLYPHSRTEFLEAIEPEPLELTVPDRGPFWQSNTFWLFMSFLAALTLIYQILLYNFDSFSRKPDLRPYYQQACSIFGCELPAMEDLSKIKVQNMVVVNHPNTPDMLLVDATLVNQASFEQAFPTLQLTFTNISNEIVSKMLFPADAYVGGELSGSQTMPTRHPIHITLEIADPGADAVNYQISIVK